MHSQDVSHRNLKHANILLRRREIFITDFGISRDKGQIANSTTDFHAGYTQAYAPPEVREGLTYNARQADVYALGCTLLHILTVVHSIEPMSAQHYDRHSAC